MRRLTDFVLNKALYSCDQWPATAAPLNLSVNVSASLLTDSQFPSLIMSLLTDHHVDPSRLTLEISETEFRDTASATLGSLQDNGISLSICDFGTGYSSLAYLRRFLVDEIKIDRSFVGALPDNREAFGIVHALLDLSRSLGIVVVAEGIETARVADMLQEAGCRIGQGHYFGRPQPLGGIITTFLGHAPEPPA